MWKLRSGVRSTEHMYSDPKTVGTGDKQFWFKPGKKCAS